MDRPETVKRRRSRSYENVGAKSIPFAEKGRQGKWAEADKILQAAGECTPEAFLYAAKLMADRNGLKDAGSVLAALMTDPISEGKRIKEAMNTPKHGTLTTLI